MYSDGAKLNQQPLQKKQASLALAIGWEKPRNWMTYDDKLEIFTTQTSAT